MSDLPTVIVVAPQGAGKTRIADALVEKFGYANIVDEWDGATPLPPGTLALTNAAPAGEVA